MLFISGRIISISWHPSEDVIVTGGIDNIRLWSVKSGRAIQRLTLGRQKNKETVVWCVAILRYVNYSWLPTKCLSGPENVATSAVFSSVCVFIAQKNHSFKNLFASV